MAKSSAEIFNDKIKIIYEYNNHSPLFVKAANTEIENNNLDNAIEILSKGIELYPQYSTAYMLLGRAYTLAGNYSTALKYIKKASDLIHSKKTYNYYFKELENNKKQRALFQGSTRNFFMPGHEIINDNNNAADTFIKSNFEGERQKPIEERLDEIANKISTAKIPEAGNSFDVSNYIIEKSTGNMIVSETLAKIYISQGELREAIEVYKKLIKKDSSKEKYFQDKIKELKIRLES